MVIICKVESTQYCQKSMRVCVCVCGRGGGGGGARYFYCQGVLDEE